MSLAQEASFVTVPPPPLALNQDEKGCDALLSHLHHSYSPFTQAHFRKERQTYRRETAENSEGAKASEFDIGVTAFRAIHRSETIRRK